MNDLHGTERISGDDRIASLDVIRGIAILFILFMNIPDMAGYFQAGDPRALGWGPWDRIAFIGQFAFLDGTQRGLLELLFGAGIMIMARRAMEPDAPIAVADLHYRRNWLLIGFGLINALVLLWFGDILITYGIVALLIFPFRLLKPRNQLWIGLAVLALGTVPFALKYIDSTTKYHSGQVAAARVAAHQKLTKEQSESLKQYTERLERLRPIAQSPITVNETGEERANRTAALPTYAKGRWGDWLFFYGAIPLFPILAEIFGTMLIGMALYQWGVMQGRAKTSTYVAIMVTGYAIGLGARSVALSHFIALDPAPHPYNLYYQAARLAVTLGHLGAIHLALRSGLGQALLRPFQANGKMPLTTYLSASFVTMWILFPSFGFGLWGRFSFAGMMALAAAIVAVQMVAANLWLKWYETGPVEWLWKTLAYKRRMPFRRERSAEALPPGLVAAE